MISYQKLWEIVLNSAKIKKYTFSYTEYHWSDIWVEGPDLLRNYWRDKKSNASKKTECEI